MKRIGYACCLLLSIQLNVISKDDLIRNKLASGREQDLLDAKNLRSAAEQDRTK